MRRKLRPFLTLAALAASALLSCQQYISYPAPTLTSLSPNTVVAGAPEFTLMVKGTNFTPASTVLWNNSTTLTPFVFVDSNEITATVTSALVQNPGTVPVFVTTPAPGGGQTVSLNFQITEPPTPIPQITSLAPSAVLAGSGQFTLDVHGANFTVESQATVNGSDAITSFQNAGFLTVTITPEDVASAGTLQIAVLNPVPPPPATGGGSSNTALLPITNPLPGIASLTPISAQAGSANVTLTLTGANPGPDFVPASVVLLNGAPQATVFDSSTQVEATVAASSLTSAGIAQIQVVNPPSRTSPPLDGGTSNALPFSVAPTLTAGLPMLADFGPTGAQADDGICGGTVNCGNGSLGLTLATSGPSLDGVGDHVAFASVSNNLVPLQTTSASTIFLTNTCLVNSTTTTTSSSTGCASSASASSTASVLLVSEVSVAGNGGPANGASSEPSVDSGADRVAFTSTATNLVNYVSFGGVPPVPRQVYSQPPCNTVNTTTPCNFSATTNSAVLISLSADGTSPGNGDSYNPAISTDGNFVAFTSLATNLVSGALVDGVTPQVYLRNTCDNVTPLTQTTSCIPTTYLVSSPDGMTEGNGASANPVVSNDGLFVAFTSSATNLGATAPNSGGLQEIFEQSECQLTTPGCIPVTTLASTPDGVTPADAASVQPAISSDGRFIAFATAADNLGISAAGVQQVYARDTCTGAATGCTDSTRLVSTTDPTLNPKTPANGRSEHPSINQCGTSTATTCITGEIVAFASVASNLAATLNGVENVFVRNTCGGVVAPAVCTPATVLASQAAGPAPPLADGDSVAPSISGDGHSISFLSFADNLVAHDTNGLEDIFLAVTSF